MKRQQKEQLRIALFSLILAVSTAGLGYAAHQLMGQPVADELGCFLEAEGPRTSVVVDVSEPRFSVIQARSLRHYFDQLYDRLRFSEHLQVFTTEGDRVAAVVDASFEICGQTTDPRQLESIGLSAVQSGYLKREKDRLHEKLLTPELDSLLTLTPDASRQQLVGSPILEMIAASLRASNLTHGDRFVLISDLINNSSVGRFCSAKNDMPRYENFKKRREYRRIQPPAINGVEVEILMLVRPGYEQHCQSEDELSQFWEEYFYDHGASHVQLIRLIHNEAH